MLVFDERERKQHHNFNSPSMDAKLKLEIVVLKIK